MRPKGFTIGIKLFNMNILFLLRSIAVGIGGIEVVTITLANKFKKEGHNIVLFALYKGNSNITDRLSPDIPLYIGVGNKYCSENVEALRNLLVRNNINVVINQMGLHYIPAKTMYTAAKRLPVKKISVYHNDPKSNGRIKAIEIATEKTDNKFKKGLFHIKHFLYEKITSTSMRYVYGKSDLYCVLSESYRNRFKHFTGIKYAYKLCVITNPITIELPVMPVNLEYKEKIVIYVGRLDYIQKRVYRVIDTWNHLEKRFPDWKLMIIGNGEEREELGYHVKALGLKNVSFEGFKNPIDYYKRASILMLTSDFEGFPLVLAECMSFGVVPAVYNSYAAVSDIISDGKDGIVIPFHKEGYNADEAARMLGDIMTHEEQRHKMSIAAIEKSKSYSIDSIYKSWNNILEKLLNEGCWKN